MYNRLIYLSSVQTILFFFLLDMFFWPHIGKPAAYCIVYIVTRSIFST